VKIATVVITCPGREAQCRATVESLHAADWPRHWPVVLCRDEAVDGTRQHRQQMNARRALLEGIAQDVPFILFLEDDVMFNAHVAHNLALWRPLRDGWLGMASLYNPTVHEVERSDAEHWFRADAGAVYGSQAYLFASDTARFIAEHWHEIEGMQDIKMSRLAAQGGWPIYYHSPSLVQHVGQQSTWGGGYHYARDFQPQFTAAYTTEHVPFNGDHHIGSEIRRLVAEHHVQSLIETGMWSAHSTREFRRMVPRRVTTIDTTDEHLIGEFGPGALQDLAGRHITMVLGNSNEKLAEVLRAHEPEDHPVFVYLDAHGVGNPLMEELDALAAEPLCRDRCVIAIHDVLVPQKPWGYNWVDWGAGAEPLSYDVIAPKLPAIYPNGYRYHYNESAAGCQRGIIYIRPRR
jgi:hypothetical protein